MEKKDFDKLRFITQMNEMVSVIRTTPYESQKQQAKKTLQAIQEQFKTRFGEYSAEHILESEDPALDEIVNEIGIMVEKEINERTAKIASSPVKYKAQYVLEELIKRLQKAV